MIKYKWLATKLIDQIKDYVLEEKNKLPTEEALRIQYNVSRQTVRQALALLEDLGLIRRVQGSGAYITGLLEESNMNTVGILLTDDKDYIYPGVIHTLTSTLSDSGFKTKVFVSNNEVANERAVLLELLTDPPRGIIIEGTRSTLPSPNVDLLYELEKVGTVVLFLYSYYSNYENPLFVTDDNIGGSALLVNQLLENGHRNIGGIFKSDDKQGVARYYGYMEAMINLGLPISDARIAWYNNSDLKRVISGKSSYVLTEAATSISSTCSACICYNDLIAHHFIKRLKAMGYQIPEDITIASFDNTYLNDRKSSISYSLTHDINDPVKQTALLMIDKLKGTPVRSQVIPFTLL